MTELILIATTSKNNILTVDGKIPWDSFKGDMKRFEKETNGYPAIMCAKRYESLKDTLDGRTKIVVAGKEFASMDGFFVRENLEDAIRLAGSHDEKVFIIGGKAVYDLSIERATKLMLTRVHNSCSTEGSELFPVIDTSTWRISFTRNCGGYSFVDYVRRQPSG